MTEKQMFDYLVAGGLSPIGAAALMGNFQAESNFNARNLQNSFQAKLGHTDDSYTEAVDNGSYTNFVRDGAGYGLAQWTYWSRKENLLNFAKSAGKSIGDKLMQLDFTLWELNGYKAVLQVLKTATSIREASDVVLKKYEQPANQSEAVQKLRAGYGQEIYDRCTGKTDSKNEEVASNMKTRSAVVNLANSWVGKNEVDGSYKSIIDIYNGYKGAFPRSTKMQYGWAWCACTWSALAIKLGYTDIMPIEISCGYLIENAKKMGCWQENDAYVAKPGDAVLYDWGDSGKGDNTAWPDHVGVIVETNASAGYYVVVEGNYSNAVKKRTLSINGRYIRGFICPKYDADGQTAPVQTSGKSVKTVAREVIAGTWGDGDARKKALEAAGYNYAEVQKAVNEILNGGAVKPTAPTPEASATKSVTASDYAQKGPVSSLAGEYKTTAALYMRHGAGTNKKAMVVIPKGTAVQCYGFYSVSGGVKWLYIQVTLDGVKYTGFSSSAYLKK